MEHVENARSNDSEVRRQPRHSVGCLVTSKKVMANYPRCTLKPDISSFEPAGDAT